MSPKVLPAVRFDQIFESMMNTPLKFDHEKRPLFQLEGSDFRAHYEDWAAYTMLSIKRHRRLIASLVALALAIACIIIPVMPRKYSAEALIYPELFSRGQGKAVALASIDAASIVNSEARLIRSDAFLRAVVKRLRLDPVTKSHSWATKGLDWVQAMSLPEPLGWARAMLLPETLDWVRTMLFPETRNHSPFDRRVAMLRNQVVVMNDSRSYLISISFTAPSADEAARVVNAFAIEYLRDKDLQRRRDGVAAAENEMGRQLAIYGDKHPKTLQAAEGLDAARASLKAAMSPQDGGQDEVTSDETVKLAVPNWTPTSPRGFVILGLSFLSALLAGIGLAIWRDRRDARRKHTVGHQTLHPQ
jgi:uncharacterized protein involved in exopolysaccharide biosynthesis